jgi:hypothetical protein
MPIQGEVHNALVAPDGRALQNVPVRITLIAPHNPFLVNGIGEVLSVVTVDTGTSGIWSAELLANSEYEQEQTYYLVDETCAPGGQKWAIRMPDGGSYELRDLLVYIPPGSNPAGPTVPGGRFTWIQNTPDDTWTIPHRLGYPPVIEVLEGLDIGADSNWLGWELRRDPDNLTTVLRYLRPVAGRAYCS